MTDIAPVLDFARVAASPSLDGPAPRLARLSPDGAWLTLLRPREDERERFDLWGWERATDTWRMLADSRALESGGTALSEAELMRRERLRIGGSRGIVSYEWAADAASLLVPLGGRLLRIGLDGAARPIPGVPHDALDARLSPRGTFVSFLSARRLWIARDGASGPLAISPDEASETVRWGEAEFVAQEEMHRFTGTWVSPDDTRLAVARVDEGDVAIATRAAIGADGTRVVRQRYPFAGTANAEVQLWLMDTDGGHRVRVDLGEDRDIYLARADWAPDGRTLYVQRQDRLQTRLDVLAVDPANGASRLLFSEHAAPGHWINLSDAYRFLADGNVVWWSERSGFGHLYHGAPDGQGMDWRALTQGDWCVTGLAGVDEAAGRVVFAGNRDDVLETHVYAVDLAAPGEPERLTEPGFTHRASMDRTGQAMIVTRSSPEQPPQVYLADAAGARLAWIAENRVEGAHPYAPYLPAHRPTTFGTIPADDGTPLHWMMIAPETEPGRHHPVFFSHYGGPGPQIVDRGWQGALAQAIVAKGWIYVQLDNRGSPNRGVDFERAIHRAMGSVEVADQRAGARWLKSLDAVDPARIATFGWSYGGYMTLKMLAADPGLYAAGIAVAPVNRWELYDTHYTERYLGLPSDPGEVYARANVGREALAIDDPLLVIHGMADDNVVLDHTTEIAATLQGAAKPFEMMLYPGATHAIAGPGLRQHVWEGVFAFLDRHMG